MFYEVRATMFFAIEDEAKDFANDCRNALPKATVIKPGEPDQQCSSWDLLHCNHDQHPNEPCLPLDHEDNCPISP